MKVKRRISAALVQCSFSAGVSSIRLIPWSRDESSGWLLTFLGEWSEWCEVLKSSTVQGQASGFSM